MPLRTLAHPTLTLTLDPSPARPGPVALTLALRAPLQWLWWRIVETMFRVQVRVKVRVAVRVRVRVRVRVGVRVGVRVRVISLISARQFGLKGDLLPKTPIELDVFGGGQV